MARLAWAGLQSLTGTNSVQWKHDILMDRPLQVPRDTSVCSLGVHYDPIDWALGWVLLTNATITVNPGTVIAAFGTNAGDGNIGTYGLAIEQARASVSPHY